MKPPILLLCSLLLMVPTLGAQSLQITEFMADPTPPVALPNAEYIEVYNAGSEAVDLSRLQIASGGRPVSAGAGEAPMEAGGYAVLVREAFAPEFERLGARVVPLRLPALTNGGDEITLLLGGDTVQQLQYTPEWYNDADRDDGGYSLAYTGSGDPHCAGNWRASTDPAGGTPGRRNAVYGQRADLRPPHLLSATVSDSGFTLTFDEAIATPVHFTVDGNPVAAGPTDSLVFVLAYPVSRGQIHQVIVLPDYADCAGNYAEEANVRELLLAEDPRPGQLVINEILFNPDPGGHDFVELYNASGTSFNLFGLLLYNRHSSHQPKSVDTAFLLRPGAYVALTADGEDLHTRFPQTERSRVMEMRLPSLPDVRGNLTLALADGSVIDAVDYHEDQHNPLLATASGVSLERLRWDVPADRPDNWYSASAAVGYGTPTHANSQTHSGPAPAAFTLEVAETTFSPDGDGHQDQYILRYRADVAGYLASLHVFNLAGQRILSPSSATLLGAAGELSWDGSTAAGGPASPGPYVVMVEIFDAEGRTHSHKSVAVVAGTR